MLSYLLRACKKQKKAVWGPFWFIEGFKRFRRENTFPVKKKTLLNLVNGEVEDDRFGFLVGLRIWTVEE